MIVIIWIHGIRVSARKQLGDITRWTRSINLGQLSNGTCAHAECAMATQSAWVAPIIVLWITHYEVNQWGWIRKLLDFRLLSLSLLYL